MMLSRDLACAVIAAALATAAAGAGYVPSGPALPSALRRSLSTATSPPATYVPAPAPAVVASPQYVPEGSVNCGGHFAETCNACDMGHGQNYCNGDCAWSSGACVPMQQVQNPVVRAVEPLVQNPVVRAVVEPFQEIDSSSSSGDWRWILWPGGILLASHHCVLIVLMCVYACIYKNKVVDEFPDDIKDRDPRRRKKGLFEFGKGDDDSDDDHEDREVGLFDCLQSPNTALWAVFCTPVLAAKNYHVGKVIDFWPGCITLTLTSLAPCCCVAVVLRAIFSSTLQRNLKRKSSFISEVIVGLFCFPCAVGRDSLEVDDEESVEVKCFFEVEHIWSAPIPLPWDGKDDKDSRTCRACCGGEEKHSFFWKKKEAEDSRTWFGGEKKERGCEPKCHLPLPHFQCHCGGRADGPGACVCGRGGKKRVCGPDPDETHHLEVTF